MGTGRHSRKRRYKDILQEETFSKPEISLNLRAKPVRLEPLPDKKERRVSPRYALEFETVIFCRGTSFRTKTCNVSLSGVLLAENIPSQYVDQVLDIVLIRKVGRSSEYYLLKGKALGAPLRSPRLQFFALNETLTRRLLQIFREETPLKD